MIETQTVLNCS